MILNNVFSRRITRLWSNTDPKYIEQNSEQSTTETATFYLTLKSVDIRLWSNNDPKFIERTSKQSTTETATI